ncbi:MAG: hypothetical protein SGI99_03380 [Pseudomonadota bacterium]|nr:hypothetical protein [Pseudomonadota bacterium]
MHRALFCLLFSLALAACNSDQTSASQLSAGQTTAEPTSSWPAFEDADADVEPQSSPTTPLPRACALVTAEQAQSVLEQGVGQMSDEPEACIWASSGSPGRITMLMVLVSDNGDLSTAQAVFNSVTGLSGNLNAMVNQQVDAKTKKSGQELDDLGDEAWLSASNADLVGTQQLVVRKGRRMLTLNVTGMGQTEGLAQRLEALARNATPRL